MAKVVLKNVKVLLGPDETSLYDISDHVVTVVLSSTYDIFETTQVGDFAKKRVAGLADNQVTFEFQQDFSAGAEAVPSGFIYPLEEILYDLKGTISFCKLVPFASSAVSSTNPEYEFEVVISDWQSLRAGVGELSTASVTWPINGEIIKNT
jgi:hypothetical protein